jgi:hypothetical protein
MHFAAISIIPDRKFQWLITVLNQTLSSQFGRLQPTYKVANKYTILMLITQQNSMHGTNKVLNPTSGDTANLSAKQQLYKVAISTTTFFR